MDAVPNAESYKYRLSQENETGDELVVQPENSTSATALAFGDLDPKTKYILRVKAVAAAGSGLTDSEYSKIFATTLAEEAAELTFEKIAATNPTYESVDVEIVPSAENLYYWQVVENSLIEGKSDREIVAALKENISELSSRHGQEDRPRFEGRHGSTRSSPSGLRPRRRQVHVRCRTSRNGVHHAGPTTA